MARPHLKLPVFTKQQVARFWRNVSQGGLDECWLWNGSRDPKHGYGIFCFTVSHVEHNTRAHRAAYYLWSGLDPESQVVRHRCDNPPCCNPAHLLPGSDADNVRDRVKRGRSSKGDDHYSRTNPERLARGERHGMRVHPERAPRGDRNHNTKLSVDQVRTIKRLLGTVTHREIAAQFSVSKSTVDHIATGICWKYVK